MTMQSQRWQQGFSGRLMVEIPANATATKAEYLFSDEYLMIGSDRFDQALQGLERSLVALPEIIAAEIIPVHDLTELMLPLFGEVEGNSLVHFPLLIDLTMAKDAPMPRQQLQDILALHAPDGRIEDHGIWREQVIDAASVIERIAHMFSGVFMVLMGLLALLVTQTECLRARATLGVMQLLGATPELLVALMVRRVGLMTVLSTLFAALSLVLSALLVQYILPLEFQHLIDFQQLFLEPGWWKWLGIYYLGINVLVVLLAGYQTAQFWRKII